MDTLTEIAIGVAVALVVGAVLAVVRWLRRRADPMLLQVTQDHGLVLTCYIDARDMEGLASEQMLDMQPGWLSARDFYFDNGVPSDAPPDDEREWSEWATSHGAEAAGWQHILIIIQSTADRSVVLRPASVEQTSSELARGKILSPRPELGGNGLLVRQFAVDLDQDPPTVTYHPEGSPETPNFKMKPGDSEAFLVIAHANRGRHRWCLQIPCLVDGKEQMLTADNNGEPFVTIGVQGVEALWWDFEKRTWIAAEW